MRQRELLTCFVVLSLFFAKSWQYATVIGEVEILQADNFERGTVQTFYLLKSPEPRATYILNVSSEHQLKYLTPGSFVQIVGLEDVQPQGRKILSSSYKLLHIVDLRPVDTQRGFQSKKVNVWLQNSVSASLLSPPHVSPNPTESPTSVRLRRAAVIIVDFADEKVMCTPQEINEIMWGVTNQNSTKRIYEIDSFGSASFVKNSLSEVDTFGPFQLNLQLNQQTECKPDDWATMAIGMAKERGVSLRGYQHFVFVLPDSDYLHRTLCYWSGLGNMGCGDRCRVWVSNCDRVGIFVHELGHNFGLAHSASKFLLRDDYAEYGDPTSWMGNKWWDNRNQRFLFTAIHRVQLGWIPLYRVPVISQTGYYKLAAFNQLPQNVPSDLPMALAVLKPDEVYKNPQPYFIFSFAHGEDVVKSDELLVHVLVDWNAPTLFVISLNRSQVYRDPSQRFSIRYEDLKYESGSLYPVMTVWIHFGCTPGVTEVSVLPQSEPYHVSRQLVPVSALNEHFSLLNSLHSTQYQLKDMNVSVPQNAINNASYSVDFIYMNNEYATFNITFGVMNRDTPLCPPIDYTYNVTVSTRWNVSCDPPQALYLTPQQFCTIECQFHLIETETRKVDSTKVTEILFHIDGTSSYSSPLHHQFDVVRVVWPLICQRGVPLVWTSPTSILTAATSQEVTMSIEIFNDDSIGCNETNFVLSVSFPSGWNWHFVDDNNSQPNSKQFVIQPQSSQKVAISVVPTNPSPSVDNTKSVAYFHVVARDNELSHSAVNYTISLQQLPACVNSHPTVVHYVPYINATTRAGFAVPMYINNTQNCNDAVLQFSAHPFNYDPTIQISFVSESTAGITVGARQGRYVVALIFVADRVNSVSSFIDITTNDSAVVLPRIQMNVLPIPCVRDWVVFGCLCSPLVDISDPRFLWDPANPKTKKYITCPCYYRNMDWWPCDDSRFELTVETNFTQYKLNATFQFPQQVVYPGNDTWQELQLSFNLSIPTLNRTLSEPLSIWMRVYLSDSYHPALSYHHLHTDQSIVIWKCQRANPIIYIASPPLSLQKVWAGGTVVWQFSINNLDNSYCPKTLFVLALNNPKKLQSMGFSWRFDPVSVILEPGGMAYSYLVIRTPEHLEAPLNVTVFVNVSSFDNNNRLLKSAMAKAIIEIKNDCRISAPQIEIVPYDPKMYITFGKATEREYGVINVTNNDSFNCTASTFEINVKTVEWNVPVPGGVLLWFTNYKNSTIRVNSFPQSSMSFSVSVSLVDNVPAGNYTILVSVSDSNENAHDVSKSWKLPVSCQKPKPVWDLVVKEKLSDFGTPLGMEISWTACTYSVDCCCPCTYEIQKNGEVIATVAQTKFLDSNTLAEMGVHFNYTVTVIDAYERKSDSRTCGVSVIATPSTSSLDYVIVLFVIISVLFIPFLVLVIEGLKWKRKLRDYINKRQNVALQ